MINLIGTAVSSTTSAASGSVVFVSDTAGSWTYTFTETATFTIAGWGAGGGGMDGFDDGFGGLYQGTGGGGGGYFTRDIAVTSGDTVTGTIGLGGTHDAYGSGGTTTMDTFHTYTGTANGGANAYSGYAGGTASGGSTNTTGSNGTTPNGGGAGNGGGAQTSTAQPGTVPGGGSSGGPSGGTGYAGGSMYNGRNGRIKITKV